MLLGVAGAPQAVAVPRHNVSSAQVYSGWAVQAPVIRSTSATFNVPAVGCTPGAGIGGGLANMVNTGSALLNTPGMLASPVSYLVTQFTQHVGVWIGLIGGAGLDQTLMQTGVDASCDPGGPSYGAFFEMPSLRNQAPPTYWDDPPTKPGDTMRASAVWNGKDSTSMTLTNVTRNWTKTATYHMNFTPELALAVAESIPYNVPRFGEVRFTEVAADGKPYERFSRQRQFSITPPTITPTPLTRHSFAIVGP